ncbi:unnamed protein product [Ceratitis capitata]|uniref:(Mediterranean fruit fly) hypothetical protein n=1 Tax=Ceratitis capitata TaxID=7213 RepID=A0A811VME4_CERCA|nr:unnamed protein product [Ceratitis capitata]
MQCHTTETTRPLTQYARVGQFPYQATQQNGYIAPPHRTVTTNHRYHVNDDPQQYYRRATNLSNSTMLTSTTPSRLHQSCHDLRVPFQEPSYTQQQQQHVLPTRTFADKVAAFERIETPTPTPTLTPTSPLASRSAAHATTVGSDSCNIANCGKILWVSRETVGVPVDNDYEAARTFAASKGYYYDREQNVRIRTNAKGLPYTPLPERKKDFLANQRAIEAVVPLVFNRRRQSS